MRIKLQVLTLISFVTGSMLFFSSCNNAKETEIDKTPVLTQFMYHRLKVGNNVQIKGENLDNLSWEPDDAFVAEVDAVKKTIIPNHVGYTQIACPGVGYLSVEVTPKYTDYDLPQIYYRAESIFANGESVYVDQYMYLGASLNAIKVAEATTNRTLDNRSTSTLLVYKTGNVKSPYVVYSSTNGIMTMCGTIISPTYLSNLSDFVSERYTVFAFDLSKYSAYFVHMKGSKENEKTDYIGGLQYYSQLGGVLLAFMLPDESKATQSEHAFDEMAEALSILLNQ